MISNAIFSCVHFTRYPSRRKSMAKLASTIAAALLLTVASAENCVLRAKSNCSPQDPTWENWDTKTLLEPNEQSCRDALKFWTAHCQHHVAATFGHHIIFAQQAARYTSTCSHVHCINDGGDSQVTRVHHQ